MILLVESHKRCNCLYVLKSFTYEFYLFFRITLTMMYKISCLKNVEKNVIVISTRTPLYFPEESFKLKDRVLLKLRAKRKSTMTKKHVYETNKFFSLLENRLCYNYVYPNYFDPFICLDNKKTHRSFFGNFKQTIDNQNPILLKDSLHSESWPNKNFVSKAFDTLLSESKETKIKNTEKDKTESVEEDSAENIQEIKDANEELDSKHEMKKLTARITIRINANNAFCTFCCGKNKTISGTSTKYKIKMTKKSIRYHHKAIISAFIKEIKVLFIDTSKYIVWVSAPRRLRLGLWRMLQNAIIKKPKKKTTISEKSNDLRTLSIKFRAQKCFNGCRARKVPRKKRRGAKSYINYK